MKRVQAKAQSRTENRGGKEFDLVARWVSEGPGGWVETDGSSGDPKFLRLKGRVIEEIPVSFAGSPCSPHLPGPLLPQKPGEEGAGSILAAIHWRGAMTFILPGDDKGQLNWIGRSE